MICCLENNVAEEEVKLEHTPDDFKSLQILALRSFNKL